MPPGGAGAGADAAVPESTSPAGALCVLAGSLFFGMAWTLVPGAEALARWSRPEVALGAGIVLGLLGLTAFERRCRTVSRLLIQVIVVLVGLRIDLGDVVRLGGLGLLLGTGVILATFALGVVLSRLLRPGLEVATLLCSGTAICGGSAIAAVGSAIRASAPSMAVALGCVFVLNAAALYIMPVIGDRLGMSGAEFGTWAGLAIHDYSSVLAGAQAWDADHAGSDALARGAVQAAAVTKGTRVLWIFPITLAAAWWTRRAQGAGAPGPAPRRFVSPLPWFIAGFLVASTVRTLLPERVLADSGAVLFERAALEEWVRVATGVAMSLALFLIGTGLSRATLRAVGWRALVLAAALWVIIGAGSLLVVRALV